MLDHLKEVQMEPETEFPSVTPIENARDRLKEKSWASGSAEGMVYWKAELKEKLTAPLRAARTEVSTVAKKVALKVFRKECWMAL